MLTHIEAAVPTLECSQSYREEAEHRIANSLQMISALVRQRARIGHVPNPQTFLLEIADRIDTVGKLHRLLGDATATGTVQIRTYLQEICNRLRGSCARGHLIFFRLPTGLSPASENSFAASADHRRTGFQFVEIRSPDGFADQNHFVLSPWRKRGPNDRLRG